MIRQATTALAGGCALLACMTSGAWAAVTSPSGPPATPGAVAQATAAGPAAGPAGGPAAVSLAPRGAGVALSGAALARAARRCAAWATSAGFANNGYLAGALTTAVAVALAESGCDPSACYDNTTKRACRKPGKAADSVDRGAWQLNSKTPDAVSARCAYSGACSARDAYDPVSQDGTYFSRWATYNSDFYAGFLPAAQGAVNALTAGTVTSGMTGSCLAYPTDRAGTAARLANCGSGAASQQWTVRGATLRTRRGLCLSVASTSRPEPVVLRRCNGGSRQRWLAHAGAALDNPAARRCLSDPGAAVRPGGRIDDARCSRTRSQTWFLP